MINNKKYDQGLNDFNELLRLNPRSGQGYYNRSLGYFGKKDYDNAFKDALHAQSYGFQVNPAYLQQLKQLSGK